MRPQHPAAQPFQHPTFTRRTALQAGAIGLLGLGLTHLAALPPGFNPNAPRPTDWPSIAAVAGAITRPRNNLPPAAILPEKLVHFSGRVIPGPFAGLMGHQRNPWLIEASPYDPTAYGAYPQ